MGLCGWSFCSNFSAVFSSASTEMPTVTDKKYTWALQVPNWMGVRVASFLQPQTKGFLHTTHWRVLVQNERWLFQLVHSFSM